MTILDNARRLQANAAAQGFAAYVACLVLAGGHHANAAKIFAKRYERSPHLALIQKSGRRCWQYVGLTLVRGAAATRLCSRLFASVEPAAGSTREPYYPEVIFRPPPETAALLPPS